MKLQWVWIFFIFYLNKNLLGQVQKIVKLDKLYQCKDREASKYLVDFRNIGATIASSIVYLHGNFTIKEQIYDPIQTILYVSRCHLTKSSQCDSFINQTVGNLCQMMIDPSIMGNRYLSKFKPPMRCPVKPGLVDISESDMILDMILKLPVEGFGWTIKAMFMGRRAKGKMQGIGCLMVHFRILQNQGKAENDNLAFLV